MTTMTASHLVSRWSGALWSGALGICAIVAVIRPAEADPRAVVELFTSQGCSSCPPADKVIGDLSSDPSIIALSMPINYWDYLGWKDTLADSRFSARQRAYSRLRGDREVYTPQGGRPGNLPAAGRGSRLHACRRQRPHRHRKRHRQNRDGHWCDERAGDDV